MLLPLPAEECNAVSGGRCSSSGRSLWDTKAAEGKLKLGTRLHERLLPAKCLDPGARERIHDLFRAALKEKTREIPCDDATVSEMAHRVDWVLDETVASLNPRDPRATPRACEPAPDANVLPACPMHASKWLEASRALFAVALPILTESLTGDGRGPSPTEIASALTTTIQTSVYRASSSYVQTMLNRIEAINRAQTSTADRDHLDEVARRSRTAIMREQLIQFAPEKKSDDPGPIISSVTSAIHHALAHATESTQEH